jgi:mannose-6-phosphate isomerase-like protein (cupin superfamily)
MYKTSRRETPFDPTVPARPGWEGMHVHWLADRLEGSGLHLTDAEPVRLEIGDLVFIPKGERHGFANDTDEPKLLVTVMGGVAHYTEAGYEIHPHQPSQEMTRSG